MTGMLIKRENFKTDTQIEAHHVQRRQRSDDGSQVKGGQRLPASPQKLREVLERFSPTALEASDPAAT